jgi:hypothetical protein
MKATKSHRFYFLLEVLTPRTEGTEFGSLLLKTPTKMDGEVTSGKKNPISGNSGTLAQEIMSEYKPTMIKLGMWPTPVSSDATTGAIIGKNDTFKMTSGLPRKINQNGTDGSVGLARLVQFLPTPTADDNPAKNTGKRNQDSLQKRAFQDTGKTSQLNPLFVMEMMGFPPNWTVLPFQNGETKVSKEEETQ